MTLPSQPSCHLCHLLPSGGSTPEGSLDLSWRRLPKMSEKPIQRQTKSRTWRPTITASEELRAHRSMREYTVQTTETTRTDQQEHVREHSTETTRTDLKAAEQMIELLSWEVPRQPRKQIMNIFHNSFMLASLRIKKQQQQQQPAMKQWRIDTTSQYAMIFIRRLRWLNPVVALSWQRLHIRKPSGLAIVTSQLGLANLTA